MTRRALDLPQVTASAALPADLTDERLLEQDAAVHGALSAQLAPERVGDELTLTVLAASPAQAWTLATYVQDLADTPCKLLNPEAWPFLDAFFGSWGCKRSCGTSTPARPRMCTERCGGTGPVRTNVWPHISARPHADDASPLPAQSLWRSRYSRTAASTTA